MTFLQWRSSHSKPSFTMVWLLCIICPTASSAGLPNDTPAWPWCWRRKCSMPQFGLSATASASARTAMESRRLPSRLTTRSVVFFRSDSASCTPWAFCTLALERESTRKCVLDPTASMSLGAIRRSTCPSGIRMPLKSSSVSSGSLSHARCTIHIIQSPYARVFEGASSAFSSARLPTFSSWMAMSSLMCTGESAGVKSWERSRCGGGLETADCGVATSRTALGKLRLCLLPALPPAESSAQNITCVSTSPSLAWLKDSGSVHMILKPQAWHTLMAAAFVDTTMLNRMLP
mmetsp:Transcript_15411/g.40831  ORF Transcript_15411/g.40831 Transcript_15411/m.40831 type:complete len:290 (-) Transcript_15411:383-1252(-)